LPAGFLTLTRCSLQIHFTEMSAAQFAKRCTKIVAVGRNYAGQERIAVTLWA
jgi:hypothetical protein